MKYLEVQQPVQLQSIKIQHPRQVILHFSLLKKNYKIYFGIAINAIVASFQLGVSTECFCKHYTFATCRFYSYYFSYLSPYREKPIKAL